MGATPLHQLRAKMPCGSNDRPKWEPGTYPCKDKLWIFSGKHTGGTDGWGGDIWTMNTTPVSVLKTP